MPLMNARALCGQQAWFPLPFAGELSMVRCRMDIFCVSESCPIGCGMPVVLLAARGARRIFCYCDGCGGAWKTPAETKLKAAMNSGADVSELAPAGVEAPTRQSIIDAGLAAAVIVDFTEKGWGTSIGQLNQSIIGDRLVGGPS
jgi:hypothetical protein